MVKIQKTEEVSIRVVLYRLLHIIGDTILVLRIQNYQILQPLSKVDHHLIIFPI